MFLEGKRKERGELVSKGGVIVETYTSEQVMSMLNVKESRFKKWCIELEAQGHIFERYRGARVFTNEDYNLIGDLRDIMDYEKTSLKAAVRRVINGNIEDFPVITEEIPQDKGVTTVDLLHTIQRGFYEQQIQHTNNSVELEEHLFELKHQINILTDHVHDLIDRTTGIEHMISLTHSEVVENGRLGRDIATDLRQLQQKKKEKKWSFGLFNKQATV